MKQQIVPMELKMILDLQGVNIPTSPLKVENTVFNTPNLLSIIA